MGHERKISAHIPRGNNLGCHHLLVRTTLLGCALSARIRDAVTPKRELLRPARVLSRSSPRELSQAVHCPATFSTSSTPAKRRAMMKALNFRALKRRAAKHCAASARSPKYLT